MSSQKQHQVPRFLLKGFTAPGRKQLFVFDKTTRRVFSQSPDRAAKEGGYYDLESPVGAISLEKSLADLESRAAQAVADIRHDRSLSSLTARRVADVAHFAAVQMLRTDAMRKMALKMSEDMAAHVKRFADAHGASTDIQPLDAEGAKALTMGLLARSHEMAPLFIAKAWILLSPPPGHYFIISDNPVTLHNSVDHGWRGSLGLSVRGIEIYLPLSRDLTLSFMCPSHITTAEDGLSKADDLATLAPERREEIARVSDAPRTLLRAFAEGTPWAGTPDNVLHVNSLQVRNAERFLYGSIATFHPAEEMIEKHPSMVAGPRMKLN